jgi:hypothetical protein
MWATGGRVTRKNLKHRGVDTDGMRSLYDRLRNPSHTGERRCWPCTVTNAALLLLGCAALARRRSRSLAVALGAVGGAAITLRGYLVPLTPRFAPRLVSVLPGDPFHADSEVGPKRADAPDAPGSLADDGDTGEQVVAALVERDVVEPDGENLYLADDFREAWREEMKQLRGRSHEELAAALRAAAPEGTVVDAVEPGDDRWFVISDGSDDPARERWLTRPVAVAEAAAVRTLADRTDLSETGRAQAAGPLRTLLDACPVCDGPVEETTAIECCGGPGGARADAPDEVLACTDCDARLYTFG